MTCNNIIYGLIDPRDNSVRYIGLSCRGIKRVLAHTRVHELRRHEHTHKTRWIRYLHGLGLNYQYRVLEELESPTALPAAEQRWIARARALGWPLTNHTDGGEGLINPSPETRARIGEISRNRSPETRAKMSASSKAQMTPARRAQISASLRGNKNALGHRGPEPAQAAAYGRMAKSWSEEARQKRRATVALRAARGEIFPGEVLTETQKRRRKSECVMRMLVAAHLASRAEYEDRMVSEGRYSRELLQRMHYREAR